MANWSETSIELSGKRIKESYKYIKAFDDGGGLNLSKLKQKRLAEGLGDYGYSYLDDLTIADTFENKDVKEDSIHITGSGRWCGPHRFIEDVVKKFGLSGVYTDAEPGSNFFHLIKFKDGEVVSDVEAGYFSKLAVEYNDDLDYWIYNYEGCFADDEAGLDEIIKEFKEYFPKDIDEDTEKEIREILSN